MLRALAVALAGIPIQNAGPHPLEGVWKITFPWHIEVVNGVVTPTMETGELRVELRGDSLIAVVMRTPSDDTPSPRPFQLAARATSGETIVETRDQVTMATGGGATRTMTAISIWIFRPVGDELSGTLERRLEGGPGAGHGALPLTGSRIRHE
jgi:hypothetical protein